MKKPCGYWTIKGLIATIVIMVLSGCISNEANMGGESISGLLNSGQVVSSKGAVVLITSFVSRGDGQLKAHAIMQNQGIGNIYVFNRLWTLNDSSKLILDSQEAYRFVADDTLHIFFGNAPLPSKWTVFYRNIPYVTLVEPNSQIEFDVSVVLPAKEYNVYFVENSDEDFKRIYVKGLDLCVQYVEESPALKTRGSMLDPSALEITTPLDLGQAKLLCSPKVAATLEVLLRSDEFSRPVLP
jgi:hypothetical protein